MGWQNIFGGVAIFFRGVVVKDDCIGRVIKFKGLGWQKIIWGSRVAKCKINLLNEEAKQFLG